MTPLYTKAASVDEIRGIEFLECPTLQFQTAPYAVRRRSGSVLSVNRSAFARSMPATTSPNSTPKNSVSSRTHNSANRLKSKRQHDSFSLLSLLFSCSFSSSGYGVSPATATRKRYAATVRPSRNSFNFPVDIRELLTYSKHMNALPLDKKLTVLSAMIEGNTNGFSKKLENLRWTFTSLTTISFASTNRFGSPQLSRRG
jgi:hypothetical protein